MSNENTEQAPLLYWADYFSEDYSEEPAPCEQPGRLPPLLVVTVLSSVLWAIIGFGLYLLLG